jgi:hypothetical protein
VPVGASSLLTVPHSDGPVFGLQRLTDVCETCAFCGMFRIAVGEIRRSETALITSARRSLRGKGLRRGLSRARYLQATQMTERGQTDVVGTLAVAPRASAGIRRLLATSR